LKKVEEAIAYVRGQSNVRSPAALLVSYLENDGWTKLTELKDYLLHMPDPRTDSEKWFIGEQIVRLIGSKPGALKALEQVRMDEQRLEANPSCETQRKIASAITCRAADAAHCIRTCYRTREEEKHTDELYEGLIRMRQEMEDARKREELAASSGAAAEAPSG